MLAVTLNEGEFVMIGETVVRITEIRDHSRARVAIMAPDSTAILRFDSHGQPTNLQRKIAQRIPVSPGRDRLILGCGHDMEVDSAVTLTAVECPVCRAHAQRATPMIQKFFCKTPAQIKQDRQAARIFAQSDP